MAKTALITGCSSGVGRATAEAFHEDEWHVWATARDEADLDGFEGERYRTAQLDVTDADECERVVERVLDTDGRLDCLVNNAGYAQFGPLEDLPSDRLRDQFDTNVFGPHRLVRAALPHMRRRGEGTVVNVSGVAGRISTPGYGAFCGSKFALEAMSDALRGEVEDFGVDVVLVQPGPVDSEFADNAADTVADADGSPEYEWLYEVYEDAALVGGDGALSIPPRAVALTIRDAALASDPDPRYPVGQFAKLALRARYLPDRWRDLGVSLLKRLT